MSENVNCTLELLFYVLPQIYCFCTLAHLIIIILRPTFCTSGYIKGQQKNLVEQTRTSILVPFLKVCKGAETLLTTCNYFGKRGSMWVMLTNLPTTHWHRFAKCQINIFIYSSRWIRKSLIYFPNLSKTYTVVNYFLNMCTGTIQWDLWVVSNILSFER